jgi:hypothetical protein
MHAPASDAEMPVRLTIVSRDGPGDSQRRPSADRNSPAGGSLIRTDGLEGAVLGGEMTHVVHPRGSGHLRVIGRAASMRGYARWQQRRVSRVAGPAGLSARLGIGPLRSTGVRKGSVTTGVMGTKQADSRPLGPGLAWARVAVPGETGVALSGRQIPEHVPGSGSSVLAEPPGGTRGKVT